MTTSRPLVPPAGTNGHLELTEQQRDEIRERLLAMLDEERRHMARLEADGMPTGSAREVIEAIEAAVARLDDGTYGVCTQCGEPIGTERLEAIPHASSCIGCQQRPRSLVG